MGKVELQMMTNAKQMLGELQQINGSINAINYAVQDMNRKGAAGARRHGSALKGLVLRFIGYNLVLNQVMGMQQKVIQYVGDSIQKYREFETRIAEVATIMSGDYQSSLAIAKSSIESLALSTGQATSDLTKGFYDIMSAAFSARDGMNLLNTATKASIAGLSDVRSSVDIFTTVLNTYGMSAYEATKVSDTLFQSVVRGKFQFKDLESALGYVVPIAAQAGIQFEELMAALSTTTRHGLHLDMASRGLAMGIQGIINPSEGARKAAKKYGVELSGTALRIKGITGVFGEMAEAARKHGKIVLNELIPNIRSLRVAMVLAGEEGMEGLLDDMDRLSVAAGRTEEAFNKIKNTSQFASNLINQHWEKTQREVGAAWDKMALGIQQAITTIAEDWKSFIPIIGPIFTAMDFEKSEKMLKKVHKAEEKYLGIERKPMKGAKQEVERLKEEKVATMQRSDIGMFERYEKAANIQKEINNLTKDRVTYTKQQKMTDSDWIDSWIGLQEEMGVVAEDIGEEMRAGNTEAAEELNEYLIKLSTIGATIGDKFNAAFGEPILGGIRNLETLKLRLDEISFSVEELEEHLKKPLEYGWGSMGGTIEGTLNFQMEQLKADQALADAKHDISMGLKMEKYDFKSLSIEMQENVKLVRQHEQALKGDTETINKMNIALRKVRIEMMKLQLVGMKKRRGLSRSEERRMQALRIQAAELQLKQMKETKQETLKEYEDYEKAKKAIDAYIAEKENEVYMLNYTYDQQIADLNETIKYEEDLLKTRKDNWRDTTNDIITQVTKLTTAISDLTPEQIKSLEELIDVDLTKMSEEAANIGAQAEESLTDKDRAILAMQGMLQASGGGGRGFSHMEWYLKKLKGYQRGTSYVHETGLAMLHRGEIVGAASGDSGGGIVVENLTISVKEIAELGSAEKLGALLSVAKNSHILNKTGKSKYRLR